MRVQRQKAHLVKVSVGTHRERLVQKKGLGDGVGAATQDLVGLGGAAVRYYRELRHPGLSQRDVGV